jgi:hypothetical protein
VTTQGIAHDVVFQNPHVFKAFELNPALEPGPLTNVILKQAL